MFTQRPVLNISLSQTEVEKRQASGSPVYRDRNEYEKALTKWEHAQEKVINDARREKPKESTNR